jgi:hypothetical protein
MPKDQWSDQQDPEQRIAELERQAEAAKRAAGHQPLTNAPGPPPPWPNAPGPYEFSPTGMPWSAAPPTARSSSAWMIISLAVVAVVILPAIGFAVFLVTQHNRGGHGGGPTPAASSPAATAPAASVPTASVATPNPPTSTKRSSDDAFKAYGEVPIPGNKTLHLPAGPVGIFFHAETPSGGFGPLSIPDLKFNLDAPTGVADPDVTESIGGTTGINNVAWRRVWIAQIPQDGDYRISTDGKVGAFIWARLAFGHVDDE